MNFYDCSRRGQLDMIVVHAGVQWFGSGRSFCRAIPIAGSPSHSACLSHVLGVVVSTPLPSLMGSIWADPGVENGHGQHCSRCGGGTALGGVMYKDVKVAIKSFVF